MKRRTLLAGVAAAGALDARGAGAAEAYPDRPVRVVVPFPAGGATDVWCRIVTTPMAAELGQSFVVDNRSGAAGMIGADAVAKAVPDGYTILFTISSLVQSPVVFRRSPYDVEADFLPVGQLGGTNLVLAIGLGVPGTTLEEFIAAGRGKDYSFGSYSPASTGHVFGQVFSDIAGLGMTHVGYRGEAPELVDLLSGRIQCALVSLTSAKGYLQNGRLRGLACLGRQRTRSLPDVPTFLELGYPEEFVWTGGAGMLAPARIPPAAHAKLVAAFKNATEDGDVQRRLAEQDFILDYLPPDAHRAELRRMHAVWTALIQRTGITAE